MTNINLMVSLAEAHAPQAVHMLEKTDTFFQDLKAIRILLQSNIKAFYAERSAMYESEIRNSLLSYLNSIFEISEAAEKSLRVTGQVIIPEKSIAKLFTTWEKMSKNFTTAKSNKELMRKLIVCLNGLFCKVPNRARYKNAPQTEELKATYTDMLVKLFKEDFSVGLKEAAAHMVIGGANENEARRIRELFVLEEEALRNEVAQIVAKTGTSMVTVFAIGMISMVIIIPLLSGLQGDMTTMPLRTVLGLTGVAVAMTAFLIKYQKAEIGWSFSRLFRRNAPSQ